jgi:hypothetical protein
MRKALAVLLVAGALAPATGAFAALRAAADGGLGIRLAEAPTSRRDDPRARIYIIDHVKPGATIQRKIVVSNQASTPIAVSLYPAAADIRNGEFFPAAGRTVNELSSWTRISQASVALRPGASQTLETTVVVPANASSGERYAVVWAEIRSAATTGIKQVNRVGIRIYLSVGPGGEPPSDFTIDTLTASRLPDGEPVVYALVHNTGGRALDMSGSLRLSKGPGGLSAGPFPATLGTTLGIKDTEPVTVRLDKALPAGPWDARIELTSGLNKRAAQATITFPAAPGPGAAVSATPVALPQQSNSTVPIVPIVGTAIALGLATLIGLLLFRRRRKRDDSRARPGRHAKHSR